MVRLCSLSSPKNKEWNSGNQSPCVCEHPLFASETFSPPNVSWPFPPVIMGWGRGSSLYHLLWQACFLNPLCLWHSHAALTDSFSLKQEQSYLLSTYLTKWERRSTTESKVTDGIFEPSKPQNLSTLSDTAYPHDEFLILHFPTDASGYFILHKHLLQKRA